jgi:hypothetical protein
MLAHAEIVVGAPDGDLALATLEHWFLMLPLPSAALWNWSLPGRAAPRAAEMPETRAVHRE